jgi:ATP-dependent DNA helicase RecG
MSRSAVETETLEHKQSLNEWREIVETVAAFATARGGTIRVGVDPGGARVGVQLGQRSLENLADQIKSNTEPPQYPRIEIDGSDVQAVVQVLVEESPIKPVWAFGRPYKRVGRTNQRLSPEETHRLHEISTGRTWDALPCVSGDLADLDRTAVEDFLRRSNLAPGTSTEGVLRNLGLATTDGLANGAVPLFAENPQRLVPEAQVKCARFDGTTSVRFLDEQTFYGGVLAQIDHAMAFVRTDRFEERSTSSSSRLDPYRPRSTSGRSSKPEYWNVVGEGDQHTTSYPRECHFVIDGLLIR